MSKDRQGSLSHLCIVCSSTIIQSLISFVALHLLPVVMASSSPPRRRPGKSPMSSPVHTKLHNSVHTSSSDSPERPLPGEGSSSVFDELVNSLQACVLTDADLAPSITHWRNSLVGRLVLHPLDNI